MKLTDKEQRICDKFSAVDNDGFVHCNECPLVRDDYWMLCKANSHYDRHDRIWVRDEVENEAD